MLGLLLLCSGCESLFFYKQAISGQSELFIKQQTLEEVISDKDTSATLKRQLEYIEEVLFFAEEELHLPVGDNFRHYVDIGRPYVVWNVLATGEFSFKPKKWCYPVVGCASYRGYFKIEPARAYVDNLRDEGNDVFVGGISAYSTLGWLDDPILSTFVYRNDMQLSALIFHELAHRILYVKGDTEFNESFASAVERIALERWLKHINSKEFDLYLRQKNRYDAFVEFVLSWKARISQLYDSDISDEKKRSNKAILYQAMLDDYENFKASNDNYQGFDAWMNNTLNNAKIITLSTYQARVPDFLSLYDLNQKDFQKFIDTCTRISRLDKTERDRKLESLLNPE